MKISPRPLSDTLLVTGFICLLAMVMGYGIRPTFAFVKYAGDFLIGMKQ